MLSDVQMPDMDGHQIAAALADRCPVILMSGAPEQQSNGVLAKPFIPDELLHHITSVLCRMAANAEVALRRLARRGWRYQDAVQRGSHSPNSGGLSQRTAHSLSPTTQG